MSMSTAEGGLGELSAPALPTLTPQERMVWNQVVDYMRDHGVGIREACKATAHAPVTFFRARRKLGERGGAPGPVATDEEAFGFSEGDTFRPSSPAVTKPRPRPRIFETSTAQPLRDSMAPPPEEDGEMPESGVGSDEVLIAVLRELRRVDPLERCRILDASRIMLGLVDHADMRVSALGTAESSCD